MPGLALVLTGLALTVAAFVALVTYRGRPQTPAVDTAPPAVDDTAVETPEAGEGVPPLAPASGDTPDSPDDDFERHAEEALELVNGARGAEAFVHTVVEPDVHGHAFCAPCRAVLCVRNAAEVIAHLRSHAPTPADVTDFAAWEQEVSR